MSEELRAIDADHFWFGELMVDINQLYYEANNSGRKYTTIQRHDLICDLRYLGYVAGCLLDPARIKWTKAELVRRTLLSLNRLGLHTGYSEEERR